MILTLKTKFMISIEAKFTPDSRNGEVGMIYYFITNGTESRTVYSGLTILREEWNSKYGVTALRAERRQFILFVRECIRNDISTFSLLLDTSYNSTFIEVYSLFIDMLDIKYLSMFMRHVIILMYNQGRIRSFETYVSALRSFLKFRRRQDILLSDIDSNILVSYQVYLRGRGLIKNSTSFYMRILRSVYNKAIKEELIPEKYPFRAVYTGIDKTIKRALPLQKMRRIKSMDLSANKALEFARDMFLFSFYTRGMSFIDMAYLKKTDLNEGMLVYKRRKTGQKLCVRCELCTHFIIRKYTIKDSPYLLPIIRNLNEDSRIQYKRIMSYVNASLRIIGRELKLEHPLTMYVARHSWASIALAKRVPVSVISQGMGHDSELTTRIYLSTLQAHLVDKANRTIIKCL